jgi:hypothetical protein
MTMEDGEALAITHLPQAHCLISTATGQDLAIGAESHRPDPTTMALQGGEALTTAYLPQAHYLIINTG